MATYEFVLKLNRGVSDDELGALYEAGLDDAGIEAGPRGTLADCSRESSSLAEAITSAVWDIEKVPGLRATGVQFDTDAAHRVLATADRVLAARDALLTEPDESARNELARLLQDA